MISRANALKAMTAERFDVVVIGGGITGAGVALDAASRGYSVALVERDDYAFGTSSRSSKMIHGGLRYLQNFDLGLVREALMERQLMVRLAPHLVYPTPFLVPLSGDKRRDRIFGIALNMYDVMATSRRRDRRGRDAEGAKVTYWSPERHRQIDAAETLRLAPALEPRQPKGAYVFYDCQTDDVRLVLTILGEAERFGAVMLNGAEVTGVLHQDGKVSGVACVEAESGESFEVHADNVVNATGVWADRIGGQELADQEDVPSIRPSRGTHFTLPYEHLPLRAACIVPAGEGRTIFALPWLGRTLVGTTDNDYEGDIGHVQPSPDDVEYLLKAINRFFKLDLGLEHLTGAYAGVRPLISTSDPKKSVDISRRAELYETSSGLLTITGGKLTTWRRMAKSVVDRMAEREGREAPCRTHEIPLGMSPSPADLDAPETIPDETLTLLAFRYGHAARNVLDLATANPDLAQPIVPGQPDLLAEAVIATRLEQARSIADILLRRTRLGLLAAPQLRTRESVQPLAEAMAAEVGWSTARQEEEIQSWFQTLRMEGLDATQLVEGAVS